MIKNGVVRWTVVVTLIVGLLGIIQITLRAPIHNLNVPGVFQELDQHVVDENWEAASSSLALIHEKWGQAQSRILLNAGFDSLLVFEESLAKLNRAVSQKATLAAQLELATLQTVWQEFITF